MSTTSTTSRVHDGQTPQQAERAAERAEADVLAGRICAAAALAAQSEAELLDLVGKFDASGAVRFWTDVKSVAHWLGWACSMTPGVAREHVRVARALRRMPTVRAAFAEGRLSYSKVRELTRVVDQVDDARLCELALTATASQLARTVSGFRAAQSLRMRQEDKRAVSWRVREDGMVELRGLLPAEEGALLVAALDAARERLRAPDDAEAGSAASNPAQADTTPAPRNADALLDVARVYLDAHPRTARARTAPWSSSTSPPSSWRDSRPRATRRTFPRERRRTRRATSRASDAWNPRPLAASPATPRCWAPSSTGTGRCSRSAVRGGWSRGRNAGR